MLNLVSHHLILYNKAVTLNDVHFKNCDFGDNLSNLEFTGTVLDILGDNVTLKNSIIENGRNAIRAFSTKNLVVSNCLIQNAMEFLLKAGSNKYNKVDSNKSITYTDGKTNYSTTTGKYLRGMQENSFASKDLSDGDAILSLGTISNTQTLEFIGFEGNVPYTKSDYINNANTLANALTNTKGIINSDGSKNYDGTISVKDTYFSKSGIASISLDTAAQGSFLYNNMASIFGLVIGQYMSNPPRNLALTSYPVNLKLEGATRFYDYKTIDTLNFSSLLNQDIATLIYAHGGLGDFDVSITEDDYIPLKEMITKLYDSNLLLDSSKDQKYINLPIFKMGGGANYSDVTYTSTIKEALSAPMSLNPYIYSLDKEAIKSDHFMSDPKAKYSTMKVAMLRATSNITGFSPYDLTSLNPTKHLWYKENASINDLINRA